MQRTVTTTAALLALSATTLAHAQNATLTYNAIDSGLSIDGRATPLGITGYSLELAPASGLSFDTGAFTSALDDGLIPDEVFAAVLAEQVNLGSAGLTGSASLGTVLPTGLTLGELDSALFDRTYSSGLGAGGDFDLVVVPKPGAGALLLAGAGLVLRRRRNWRGCHTTAR